MSLLEGERVFLRALEPGDLDFLYTLENDPGIWEVSGTLAPYSRKVLQDYLDHAHRDIFEVRQLRMAVCQREGRLVGLADLYDFDPAHLRAGVGIVIAPPDQGMGYGQEALALLCRYAFRVLHLHQLYAGVGASNTRSLKVFENLGFLRTGIRRDWQRTASGFRDEVFLQKIRDHVS